MLNHLLELRRRSIHSLIFFGILFLLFFFVANDLFLALMTPLLQTLPAQDGLIATQITAPVFTPLQLAADAAMLASAPYVLFHLWQFIRPGLYQQEQKTVRFVMSFSLLLFILGVLFCFYCVLPTMFHFFAQTVPAGVRYMPDINHALDFMTRMLLIFGLCFQIPLLCCLLVRLRIVDLDNLKKIRAYVLVSSFIIGMLFTPDVFSQAMLALPLYLLYELGIILAVFFL